MIEVMTFTRNDRVDCAEAETLAAALVAGRTLAHDYVDAKSSRRLRDLDVRFFRVSEDGQRMFAAIDAQTLCDDLNRDRHERRLGVLLGLSESVS